jgi:catechol 2,3-dioxygenase-like lactoylglutathione lyase family enzyme
MSLDHVTLAVRDLERSIAFYDRALAPLGIKRLIVVGADDRPDFVGYGEKLKPYFWLGRGEPVRGYLHFAFAAAAPELVDAFHTAALEAGGRDNGLPGLRPRYHSSYYGAFVLDPDGCNVEAVHHGFAEKAMSRASN